MGSTCTAESPSPCPTLSPSSSGSQQEKCGLGQSRRPVAGLQVGSVRCVRTSWAVGTNRCETSQLGGSNLLLGSED